MIPSCSHVGTPRHFQSSTTSGTAWWISVRTLASTSPRQSPRSSIRSSISEEGDLVAFAFVAADVDAVFFTVFFAGFFAAGAFAVACFAVDFFAGGMSLLVGAGGRGWDRATIMAR